MRFLYPFLLLLVPATFHLVQVQASRQTLYVGTKRSRSQMPDWPFAFFVSQMSDNSDWCITARQGVSDGCLVGIDHCDFQTAPNTQLFLLAGDGKIHSAVNTSKCVVVDKGTINQGHSPLRFQDCSDQHPCATFTHDRESPSFLQVTNTTYCIKPNGNAPQKTDRLKAFACPSEGAGDFETACFMFEYREHDCSITSLTDVSCCDTFDCGRNETCKDYSCVCTLDPPLCCRDQDCPVGQQCKDNACIGTAPIPSCDIQHFRTDCCYASDCPTGYVCESNTCMTTPFYLVSHKGVKKWCVTATPRQTSALPSMVASFELCKASAGQSWQMDRFGRFRSNLDREKCLIVGPDIDTNGIVDIRIDTCNFNSAFAYNAVTRQVQIVEDDTYCLSSYNGSISGEIHGEPCDDAGVVELQVV